MEPVILELEREPADVLLIAHASVIRCLMAYLQVRCFIVEQGGALLICRLLQGLTPQEIPNVELRRGDVVQVTPSACECPSLSIAFLELTIFADGVTCRTHFAWQ